MKNLLIGTTEIAGIGATMNEAFRKAGINSTHLVFERHFFGYKVDKFLDLSRVKSKAARIFFLAANFINCLISYDSFVFLYGSSLLPRNIDLPVLKFFGKKIAVIFCGCDIRQRDISLKNDPELSPCRVCGKKCYLSPKKKIVSVFERYANVIFSHPEYSQLLTKKYEYFFAPLDLREWRQVAPSDGAEALKVCHAPSDRVTKGTKYIIDVAQKLKREGFRFDFILLENMRHDEVKTNLEKCDIVIDQLLTGWHGYLALEAMALGKPVISYIRDDLKKYSPELPILSCSPENIHGNLKLLLGNERLRRDLGRKGAKYVSKYHDADKVAKTIIDLLSRRK